MTGSSCRAEISSAVHNQPATKPDVDEWLHADNEAQQPLYGLTAIVPVNGPRAAFWNADKKLMYPRDARQARRVLYGVGDVMLLRQRLQVVEDGVITQYEQEYHGGFAPETRRLALFDMQAARVVLGQP